MLDATFTIFDLLLILTLYQYSGFCLRPKQFCSCFTGRANYALIPCKKWVLAQSSNWPFPCFRMLAVGEVGSWLPPPWNPVHHLDSRLDSESPAPRVREEVKTEARQREEVKPPAERIRKKSRKKTAEPPVAVSSSEVDGGGSPNGPHTEVATQVKRKENRNIV